ncbi:5-guanidino-2-oxopentanoate decarboxylase [Rhodobacteraceae bacterium NNCM2]|nr:5-guanidino-2-oxopentanoate decarboxylase [Coraliihabitans acroporae]
MRTVGEQLVEWLEAYDVDTVFGIPGVHTVEMYRGLARSSIRHMTPRHEQGAGFMADGYWRATGKVAACFVITGPGLTNILTPMAQAYNDSVPMLVVSAVNRRSALGMGAGDLHEIANQGLIASQAAAFSHTLSDPSQLGDVLARAWAVFESARPRPVHIEIPVDMFSMAAVGKVARPCPIARPQPSPEQLAHAMSLLEAAERPLILAGGGAKQADVQALAEHLSAPVVMTTNGRGILPHEHPLAVSASPSLESVRSLIAKADVVLAVGTEVGRTDYNMYDREEPEFPGTLIRIEIDAQQMRRGCVPDIPLLGDAAKGVAGLIAAGTKPAAKSDHRAKAAREAAHEEIGETYRRIVAFVETVRDTLPEAPIVSDSTQAAYAGNLYYGAPAPNLWFGAATGYGALGYGLPAAIGAARATGAPVVCLAGDGGLQFSLAELGLAVEEAQPLILIVWDNKGYGEIKSYMVENQITPVGVDLHTPDFIGLGKAYGAETATMTDMAELPGLLTQAAARQGPTLIYLPEAVALG